jgi:Protein of unknown function (DUF3078)
MIYSTVIKNQRKYDVMRNNFLRSFIGLLFASICSSVFSQEVTESFVSDSILIDSVNYSKVISKYDSTKPEILLSNDQAVLFLTEKYQSKYWNNENDILRRALGQLIHEASHPPIDSATFILKNYPYDSLSIPWDKFYRWDSLSFKIPVVFPPKYILPIDSVIVDNIDESDRAFDSLFAMQSARTRDSLFVSDSVVLATNADSIAIIKLELPDPLIDFKPTVSLKDTAILAIVDTLKEVSSSTSGFPFRYFSYPYQSDSIQVAVQSLLSYVEARDSSIINFTGAGNVVTPVWLNSKSNNMIRYWLNNEFADSVTIWIGSTGRDTIGMYIEQGVNFRRPGKQANYSEAKINVKALDNSKLLDVQKIVLKTQYWKYRTEASFILNQAALTNWVKGGENSISTAVDVTTYADFNNKEAKLSSSNFARMKLGFLRTGDNGIRKNLDLLETSSKLNHKAFGKFDFSGIMLFKTQVATGFTYATVNEIEESTLVSKMFNPTILTIGFGLDYKPNKNTSINFAPLSYKGTFVPDTANIDQTKYGILADKKSKNEPGVSLMISNKFSPIKNLTLTNRVQLFTNYINNPQNIDVDWELIAVASLNWFTDVRFNAHLIFDDDTKTPKLNSDNSVSNTARIQFKEMLGFSFIFKF